LAFDIAKYRALFLEEGAEHLSEISAALLALEKDAGCVDAIDVIFRMAHSIKSMAASLGYDSISEVSHRLEDRMETIRSAARVADAAELGLLFRGLEVLEEMIDVVRKTGEAPPLRPELVDALTQPGHTISPRAAGEGGPVKKPES
jgi:two-component system chemotaxis sensor kinase CheA